MNGDGFLPGTACAGRVYDVLFTNTVIVEVMLVLNVVDMVSGETLVWPRDTVVFAILIVG